MKSKLKIRNSRSRTERRNLDDMLTIYIEGKAKEYYNGSNQLRERIDDRVY
ncbi:hypothetical protein LCGC14_1646960, partial [marine sediment metagenome]